MIIYTKMILQRSKTNRIRSYPHLTVTWQSGDMLEKEKAKAKSKYQELGTIGKTDVGSRIKDKSLSTSEEEGGKIHFFCAHSLIHNL